MNNKIDKIYNQSRDLFHYNILNLFVRNDQGLYNTFNKQEIIIDVCEKYKLFS